jgi:hypothetical protein
MVAVSGIGRLFRRWAGTGVCAHRGAGGLLGAVPSARSSRLRRPDEAMSELLGNRSHTLECWRGALDAVGVDTR